MLLSTNYCDKDGRLIRSKSQNHIGGTDVVTNTYSFTGELLTGNVPDLLVENQQAENQG